jgi:hypothetical protein
VLRECDDALYVGPAQAGIQYSETSVMEQRTRGVLGTPPSRGVTAVWSIVINVIARSSCDEAIQLFAWGSGLPRYRSQ